MKHTLSKSLPFLSLIDKIPLRQRQRLRRLRLTYHTIRLDRIPLRIDLHLGLRIIELHIPLTDIPTILHSLNALAQAIRLNDAGRNGSLRDESDAG